MASNIAHVSVQVTFANHKALRALRVAIESVESIAEDMTWRPEAKRAVKALRYAAKHLKVVSVRK